MTAIIYDGDCFAADQGHFTRGYVVNHLETKIKEYSRGIFATSGKVQDEVQFQKWLEGTIETFDPGKDFEAIFTDNNIVYYTDDKLIPEPAHAPIGLGSAGIDCEVLCRIGMTGPEALKKVMKYHRSLAGKIDVVRV